MTLSYNKTIFFPCAPKRFKVDFYGESPVSAAESLENNKIALDDGKKEATQFYQGEILQLREEIAENQKNLLSSISEKVDATLNELDKRLPDLVTSIVERVLPEVNIDGDQVKSIVVSMIEEFSNGEEKLDVFLCKQDLDLLKALSNTANEVSDDDTDDGFASAIAGIFDGLEGDDSLIDGYPNVKFHQDDSLLPGDCQVKSRYGLLDGRISTKLRKVHQELNGND